MSETLSLPARTALGPDAPAGAALAAYLGRHAAALLDQAGRLRRAEPDAAHKMRVAARRMRGGLAAFGVLVDADWNHALRGELRWLADALAGERDREVVLERLMTALDELEPPGPPVTRPDPADPADPAGVDGPARFAGLNRARKLLRTRLTGDLSAAHEDALTALATARYRELAGLLSTVGDDLPLRQPADERCAEVLPPLVRRAYRRLARDVRALPAPPGRPRPEIPAQSTSLTERQFPGRPAWSSRAVAADDEPWHRVRILAKRVRYAAEAVAPVFGPPAAAFAARMTEVTELIGQHQDASVAAGVVREVVAERGVGAPAAFVLGLVHAGQRAEVALRRLEFAALWPEVSRRGWRRWLGD
jgi:CHAD domain-containing protein